MSTQAAFASTETISTSRGMMSCARGLSNHELIARVKELADHERRATAVLIAHLSVLDERQLYLAEGCSSLFTYLTQVLHLSEHAAYGRIQAARAARRYPVILDLLGEGSVNLTTITLLARELTTRNHRELLTAVRHKSRRQVEELVAQLRPRPPVPSSMRRLPNMAHSSPSSPPPETGSPAPSPAAEWGPPDAAPGSQPNTPGLESLSSPAPGHPVAAGPAAAHRSTIIPLAPQCYRVQFTASAEMRAKLRAAQDLLRHQIPDGDVGKILDHALTALLTDLTKQKFAATDRPRGSHGDGNPGTNSGSRHIPADVRRAVWIRDGGRCAYTGRNGRRCTERGFLEFHHVVPHSAGGQATADNIQLRCRAHNNYEANLYFGSEGPPVRDKPVSTGRPGALPADRGGREPTGPPGAAT